MTSTVVLKPSEAGTDQRGRGPGHSIPASSPPQHNTIYLYVLHFGPLLGLCSGSSPGPPALHKYKLSRVRVPGVSRGGPRDRVPGSCVPGSPAPGQKGIFFIFGLLGLHFGPSFPGVWLLSWGRPGVQRRDFPRGRRDMLALAPDILAFSAFILFILAFWAFIALPLA